MSEASDNVDASYDSDSLVSTGSSDDKEPLCRKGSTINSQSLNPLLTTELTDAHKFDTWHFVHITFLLREFQSVSFFSAEITH